MRGERPFYLATDYDQGFRPLGLASLNLTSSLSDCRRHAPELRVGRLVNVVPPAAVGAHSCCGSEREHGVYVVSAIVWACWEYVAVCGCVRALVTAVVAVTVAVRDNCRPSASEAGRHARGWGGGRLPTALG